MFEEVYKAIDDIADYLVAQGVEIPSAYKRRDPQEPGRAIKEMYEDKLMKLVKRRFRTQKKQIEEGLRWILPQKVIGSPDEWMDRLSDDVYEDAETEAAIMALFVAMVTAGTQLAAEHIVIGLDWTAVNNLAIEQARNQYLGFIKNIDDVTEATLREALENFVSVEGFSIGDIADMLPFEPYRAQRIAVTETTRLFARAEQTAGEELRKLYPNLTIIKTWFTEADGKVCEICRPMDGQIVPIDGMFITGEGIYISMPDAHIGCRCWMVAEAV